MTKKKRPSTIVSVNLPIETIKFLDKVTELCGADRNSVINVILALKIAGIENANETSEPKPEQTPE